MTNTMNIEGFFDEATSTISYIVLDSEHALRSDRQRPDYDPKAGRTATRGADRLIARIRELGATLEWILETHVHADHLSAAPYLQAQLGGKLAIGGHITTVQKVFGKLFNAGTDFARDGSQFNRLFDDGESFSIGTWSAVQCTPRHTPPA